MPIIPNIDGIYTCAICQYGVDSIRSLMMHVTKKHAPLKSKDYYDQYVKGKNEGICRICGKPTKFHTVVDGYRETCSHDCAAKLFFSDAEKVENRKKATIETSMQKYGVRNGGWSAGAQEKIRATNMARRGVAFPMQSKEVVNKSKATCMARYNSSTFIHSNEGSALYQEVSKERFGASNFFGSEQGKMAAKKGMMEKYGVDNYSKLDAEKQRRDREERAKYNGQRWVTTEEFKQKSRATQFARYGTWYSVSAEGRAAYREIMMERYGVPEYFQSEAFKETMRINRANNIKMQSIAVGYDTKTADVPADTKPVSDNTAIDKATIISHTKETLEKYDCVFIHSGNDLNVTYRCNRCGHTVTMDAGFLVWRNMYGMTPCTICVPVPDEASSVSDEEKSLDSFVKGLGVSTTHYERDFIGRLGADIVVDDAKLIIEYDGLFWHCDLYRDRYYHIRKTLMANEKGYRLIHVFSDEWVRHPDLVKNRIANALGKWDVYSGKVIDAKDCVLRYITDHTDVKFLEENSLEPARPYNYVYGLYHEKSLVAAMYIMTGERGDVVTLQHYCTRKDLKVNGGARRIFKAFCDSRPNVEMFEMYSDVRWDDGNTFHEEGFKCVAMTEPECFAVKGNRRIPINAESGMNNGDILNGNVRMGKSRNYIYDCGQYRYVWKRGEQGG